LKTVRPGAATRERFLEGEGEKAFWCHGGENERLSFRSSGGCRWRRISAIPVRSVTRPGTRQGRHRDWNPFRRHRSRDRATARSDWLSIEAKQARGWHGTCLGLSQAP